MKPKTPQAIEDCYQLLLWIIPLLDQFPRNRKFSLGNRLESCLLDVLDDLLKARWKSNARQNLSSANSHLDMVRHIWRLCHDLQIISTKRYEYGIRLMLGIGKQIGGWKNYK